MSANDDDPAPPAPASAAPPASATPEILHTDASQRHKVEWSLAAIAIAALLLWFGLFPFLHAWMNAPEFRVMLYRVGLVFYGLSALMLATAAGCAWYAWRILRASQFPPPGSWLLRDARVLRGDAGRARGWWVVACGVSFVLLAAYTAWAPSRVAHIAPPPKLLAPPAHTRPRSTPAPVAPASTMSAPIAPAPAPPASARAPAHG